jgi:putative flippase GtrA
MKASLSRLLELRNYFFASCCALVVDVGLLLFLSQECRMPYLLAATLSFIAGGVLAYHLSVRYVFVGRGVNQGTPLSLALFVALGLIGLLINTAVLALTVGFAHSPLLTGKVVAAGCTFYGNYWMRRRWVFSGDTLLPSMTRQDAIE